MWNSVPPLRKRLNNKILSCLLLPGLILTVLPSNFALAAFANVDCTDAGHLTTLGIPQTECEALEAFWDSTGGPGWTSSTWWDTVDSVDAWEGLTVTSGNVTRISLSENNLTGTLPTQLGNLTSLSILSLWDNQLTGPIPTEIGNLVDMAYLDLSANQLNGSLPSQLGSLVSMIDMRLDHNQFTGQIPLELGNMINLDFLRLNSNDLTGPIPVEFQNLTSLRTLHLGARGLSGRIPDLTVLPILGTLTIAGNAFVFEDFEAEYVAYKSKLGIFSISPQAAVDVNRSDTFVEGQTLTITPQYSPNPSGNDTYQWYKDQVAIPGPAGTQPVYTKTAEASDAGVYWYYVNNTVVTGLQLLSIVTNSDGIIIDITQDQPPDEYTVGGTTVGLTGTGLQLQNNGTDNLNIAADGGFVFATALADLSTYAVSISTQPTGQTCSVSSGSGSIAGANITNVAVNCVDDIVPTYTIGGATSGLTGNGLQLQNNATDTLSINANGGFVFAVPLADLSAYSVTVSSQPAGQSCSVNNGSGTIAGANITSVVVDCIDDAIPPVTPPSPATPIPTLSEWALMVLLLLLGLVVISNRKHIF